MQTHAHQFHFRLIALSDAVVLVLSLLIATRISGSLETGMTFVELLQLRLSLANVIGLLLLISMWLLILRARGLYWPQPPSRERWRTVVDIMFASGIGTMAIAAMGMFFNISLFSPVFFVVFYPTVILLTLLFRRLTRLMLRGLHLGDNNRRNVVIIGTGEQALAYAQRLRVRGDDEYRLLGFIDEPVMRPEAMPDYLGPLDAFGTLLEKHVIDEVVIAMPIFSSMNDIRDIINITHERGITVRFPISQVFSGIMRDEVWRVRQEPTLGYDPDMSSDLILFSGHALNARFAGKRLFDIVVASVLILLTAPLMLFAAAAIALSDGRPVLFRQDRHGYNGRLFKVLKFRTMVKNADALQDALRAQNQRDGAAFKLDNDPRVLPIGGLLRKTSIDELPQLFNVLAGEMSLVGPRPLPVADYRRMNINAHRRRLSVLPGITGTWQISGRDHISFDDWMQMDLDYIDNWRFLTDLRILLMTVPTVLFGRGSK